MVFKYFNASEAAEIGVSLADQFASGVNLVRSEKKSPKVPGSRIQEILARADRDVRPLQLNFTRKRSSLTRSSGDCSKKASNRVLRMK